MPFINQSIVALQCCVSSALQQSELATSFTLEFLPSSCTA